MKILKILLPALAISLMITIFIFSAAPADESAMMSFSVGRFMGHIFVSGFDQMDESEQLKYVESVDHAVRKTAHATEFLALGVLCTSSLLVWTGKRKFIIFLSGWGIAVLYAVSDEIHQIYVPGRACMFTDMLIDAGGAAAGVILLALILKACWRHKNLKKAGG